jgi:ABC-type transport system involved in multi-copper enzyme maturation permease subunit
VARKDFSDAVRSKVFWVLSIIMILFAYIGMYAPRAIEDDPDIQSGITILRSVTIFLIPIIALIVGYMSIAGERQSDSIRMLSTSQRFGTDNRSRKRTPVSRSSVVGEVRLLNCDQTTPSGH